MTIRDTVAQLYTPIYDEFMLATYDEPTQKHTAIFQTIMDHTKEYKVDGLSGLGRWVDANEAAGGGFEDPILDYPKTLTQAKFWKKLSVSFESVDQDEYAILKKEEDARAMGRGARDKVEYDTAAVLSGGFATAGPDGQFLFSNSHPKNRVETGVTYDNLLDGAFSHDSLELAETQITNNFFDLRGIPIAERADAYICYPPALRGAIERVLSDRADERPGTTNRDINRFAGKYKKLEWIYLSSTFGGSDTAWYIVFPGLGMLKIVWSAKPHFTSWIDEDLELYNFKGRMLMDCGGTNWRLGFASTGF